MAGLDDLDARAAADGLARGDFSSEELIRATLARIESANPSINAYLHVARESAIAGARASDARRLANAAYHPLDGLPVAVKDNIAVAGMPWTAGMAAYRDRVAAEDAYCVARLRKSGAVILGKLHLHEAALGASSDNPHFGPCHNPHRIGFSPGGSSGGSAAALAARMAVLTLGTDTMGSVRIPAAYCGVVGLKPSNGRVSQRGLDTVSRRLDHVGPMARRVGDLGLIYQQISSLDAHDPQSRAVPLGHLAQSGAELRVGVMVDLDRHGVDAKVADAFDGAIAALSACFPTQIEVRFDGIDFGRLRRAGLLIAESEMNLVHSQALAERPELFSPALREMLAFARSKSAVDLIAADRMLDTAIVRAREIFQRVDVLLTPTTPQTAFPFSTPTPVNQADLTSFANFAGLPALSLPAGKVDGLPVGLQVIGPLGSDLALIELGEVIEVALAIEG